MIVKSRLCATARSAPFGAYLAAERESPPGYKQDEDAVRVAVQHVVEANLAASAVGGRKFAGQHRCARRLPGRPYTALVLVPDSFDALQWHPDGRVTTIEALVVAEERTAPTGASVSAMAGVRSGRTR
jgi:hypothetical protein